jgi:hypothetical protein
MSVVEVHGHLYPRGNAHELHVHGVTFRNYDGSSRQKIIALLSIRDPLRLVREPNNASDPNAIRIDSRYGSVGHVPIEQTAKIAANLDAGQIPNVFVQWVWRGTPDKPTRGVGVIIDFDTPASAHTPPPCPSKSQSLLARVLNFIFVR